MRTSFPASIESMDCDWLTRVLRKRDLLQSGSVVKFTVETFDSGYTSSIHRLHLAFDDSSTSAPRSVIAKFHSKFRSIRKTFERLGIYEKEVGFYRFVGTDMGLPVPTCYAAEFDHDSGDFVLLLEDLSAARAGSWEVDPLGDIRQALPQLAKIHARFWGDPSLQQSDWVVKPFESAVSSLNRSDWGSYLHKVKTGYRDQWPEYAWKVCDCILESWDEIMCFMNLDTHTLIHTDAHLGQMFFPSAQLPRFVLFDWQYPCKALAAEDVTHLIVNELSIEERREHESALVELYYQSLRSEGVVDLSRDRFWFQCKLGLMWLILMHFRTVAEPDLLQTLKAEAEAAGDTWQEWVFEQLGPAITDWQLSDVLDQAIAEVKQTKL